MTNRGEEVEAVTHFLFLGSQITEDSDWSHEIMGLDDMIFVFLMLSFKPAFSLSSFIKRI